jgi:hypothetical protein
MNKLIVLLTAFAFVGVLHADVLTWKGDTSTWFYTDSNWVDQSGRTIPGGTIEPNKQVNQDLVIDTDTTVNGSGGTGAYLWIGTSGSLIVTAGAFDQVTSSTDRSILSGSDAGPLGIVTVSGTGRVLTKSMSRIALTLGGSGLVDIRVSLSDSGGDTFSESTANFLSDKSRLIFKNVTVAETSSILLGQLMVNGAAAVIGSDAAVYEAGDNLIIESYNSGKGSQIVAVIP